MTAAQQLAKLQAWLVASSAPRLSPCARLRHTPRRGYFGQRLKPVERCDDVVVKGRYAEILPVSFDEPFSEPFSDEALPLLVSFEQAEGLTLPAEADLSNPPSQPSAMARLLHLQHRCQEALDASRAGPERFRDTSWPSLALVPLYAPDDAPRVAVGHLAASLPADTAVIVVPVWRLARTRKIQARLESEFLGGRRPFLAA